jgi:26S proteasome regulatory subunit N5
MKADDPVTKTHRRKFGWANEEKEDRGDAEEGNPKQTDHASLSGWRTRPHTSSYKSPARTRSMAEQKKQERDFTPEVDIIIPETTALAQVSWVAQSSNMHVLTTLCSPVNFRKLSTNSLLLKNKQEMSVSDILFITCTTEPRKQASDLSSTTRLGKAVVERCYEARDYSLFNSSLNLLCKKHGQLKGVVQALVEQAIGWLKEIKEREDTEKWLELIETLRSITEGKVCNIYSLDLSRQQLTFQPT